MKQGLRQHPAASGQRNWGGPWWMGEGTERETPHPARFLLVAIIGAVQVVGTTIAADHQNLVRQLDAIGYGLLISAALALLLKRGNPEAALVLSLAATLAYWLANYPEGPIFIALGFAYVNALKRGKRRSAWIAAGVGYLGFIVGPYLIGDRAEPTLGASLAAAAWLVAGTAGIEMMRTRREQANAAAQHRREETRRQASEERLSIARDLHDVLAHNISLINVQAGVALHLMDERPEQARVALTAIKEASHVALEEVRGVLGALRQEGEEVPRSPASTLERLDDLVTSMAAAGIALRHQRSGDVRPLPANVDLAAFRIVQEALTNVARHSGAEHATVTILYGPHDLEIEITDDGGGVPGAAGGGNGIPGMRERAVALEGRLEAGPRPEGGFRVWARLPVGAPA
ncbi:MAG: histidine kinase [Actinomycetota bacterium]|nr:histidine kinase [Actinomycetota bacterium]